MYRSVLRHLVEFYTDGQRNPQLIHNQRESTSDQRWNSLDIDSYV